MTNNLCGFFDKIGMFTNEQMIAIGVLAAIAVAIGFLIGGIVFYALGAKTGKKQGEKRSAALAKKKMAESMAIEIDKALSKAKKENAALKAEKEQAVKRSAALESEKQKAQEENERLQAEKEASLREKERLAAEKAKTEEEKSRLAEEKARSEEEKARLAEEKAKADEEKARLAEEKAKTEEEKERLLEEKAKAEEKSAALKAEKERAEMERAALEEESRKAQEEKIRLQAEKEASLREKERLAEEKARTEEEKAKLIEAKAKAEEKNAALKAEKEQAELERQRLLAEKEKAQESAAALQEAREKEQAALNEAKERLEKAQSEARSASETAQEAQERIKKLKESEAAAIAAATAAGAAAAAAAAAKQKKKKITLLSKQEILDYAAGLDEYLPVNIYERGGENLPDSCRVGLCTFMLVYERKGMVKLVLRLHKKTANALSKQFKLFTKAVYPKGGDWYKWILSSEVTDLDLVTAAVRMAYKYAFLMNYDEISREADVDLINQEEFKINEAILKYQNLPDRDFIVASDASGWEEDAYGLYGKEGMAEFARLLSSEYPVTVIENESPMSPSTFKVAGKSFMLAYEKDGISKMIFRASDREIEAIKKKHPKVAVSPFPKASGYKWYVTIVDETFHSNEDIEDIIRTACAHVNALV